MLLVSFSNDGLLVGGSLCAEQQLHAVWVLMQDGAVEQHQSRLHPSTTTSPRDI